MNHYAIFALGMILGGCFAVVLMCCLAMSKGCPDKVEGRE